MRLTIIPVDKAVYKDSIVYHELELANCNIPSDISALQWDTNAGWIEFSGFRENQSISELPEWATKCVSVWEARDYEIKHPPAPTPEQIIAANEEKAKQLLADSDWTQLSDVNLANKNDWDVYRQALRIIATNPTISPAWPTEPIVIWPQ
jgi:hypothetical protein